MHVYTRASQKGFTLIELLVVIAIIGLLASVVLASLNSAREKGRDARRAADMKQLQLALELYYDDNSGNYPAHTGNGNSFVLPSSLVDGGYLPSLPEDPKNGFSGGGHYRYYRYGSQSSPDTSQCGSVGQCYGFLVAAETVDDLYSNRCKVSGPTGAPAVLNNWPECGW